MVGKKRNSPSTKAQSTPKQTSLSKFFSLRNQPDSAEEASTRKRTRKSVVQPDDNDTEQQEQKQPAKRSRNTKSAADTENITDEEPARSLGVDASLEQKPQIEHSDEELPSKRPRGRPRGRKPMSKDQPEPETKSTGVVEVVIDLDSSEMQEEPGSGSHPRRRSRGRRSLGSLPEQSEIQSPEEPVEDAAPRRRGRPPKNALAKMTAPVIDSSVTVSPRRRGRQPKIASESEPAAPAAPVEVDDTTADAPRRRGRPRKNQTIEPAPTAAPAASDDGDSDAPRRRGRQLKNVTEPELAVPATRGEADDTATDSPRRRGRQPTSALEPEPAEPVEADDTNTDTPRRRGRQSESVLESEPAVPAAPVDVDNITTNTPRRRGRPRKDPATEPVSTSTLRRRRRQQITAQEQPTLDAMIGSFGSQTRGGRSRRPVAHINYAEQIDTSISTPASNAVDDGDEDEFTADPETVASDDDQMSDAVPEELEEPEAQESEESESAPKKRGKGSSTTKKQKRPKARWAIEKNVPKSQMQVRHIKQPAEWEGPIPKYHSPNPIRIDIGFEEPIWNLLRNARMDFSKLTIESTPPQSHLPPFADESEDADTSGSSALDMRMLDANAQPLKNSSLRVDVLRAEPLECDTQGWAINAGISVCSIDWVPVAEGTSPKYDFIAVGGMNGTYKENMKFQISTKESTPAPGSIQIWRLNTEEPECQLDMVLVHNFGRCISLKWCPISMPEGSCGDGLPIQGYLAAIFGDGYLRVCGVPAPGAVRAAAEIGDDQTVYMQWPKGVLETKWIHGIFTSLDWVGTGVVMAGTSTGHLTLWSLAESIPAQRRALDHQWPYTDPQPIADHRPADDNEVVPMMALRLHQGAIISAVPMFNDVASPKQPSGFVRIVQRNVQVLTICNGGRMKQISLAFPHRYNHPLVSHPGLPNCFIWLYETGDLVMSDCDNMIRSICHFVSPNTNDPWMLSCLHQPPREQPPGRIHGGRRGVPMYWNDSADCGTIQCVDLLAKALMAQASEFHTYYAVAAEDGDLIVQNSKWLIPAKKITPMYRCIYRLLWEYEDGDVDMDGDVIGDKETTGTNGRLVCVERQPVQNRELKNSASTNFTTIFPPQIAVQACAWSRNRKSSAWIASGGASGLVRIEDVSP